MNLFAIKIFIYIIVKVYYLLKNNNFSFKLNIIYKYGNKSKNC